MEVIGVSADTRYRSVLDAPPPLVYVPLLQNYDSMGSLMVAVDGAWTMSQQDAVAVVEQLQPRVVLPMHYFSRDVLLRFLNLARGKYAIDVRDSPVLDLSRTTMPPVPTVIALPGGY